MRDDFLASKDTDPIIETVIPKLTAYKALMSIREIQLTKQKEEMVAKKKAERMGIKKEQPIVDADEKKPTEEQIYAKKIKEEEKEEDEFAT